MPDLDPHYSSNGNGAEHRSELRSAMPFFPSPPGSLSATGPSAPATGSTGTVPPPLRGEVLPGGRMPADSAAGQGAPPALPSPSLSSLSPSAPAPAPESAPAEAVPSRGGSVKGQIKIEDEVVEKIAALAALEVSGVAGLGGRREASETMEAVRQRIGAHDRAEPGVRALVTENEISLDLALIVEYGSVVIDVAKVVKSNVARTVGLMLGMRVSAVNVTVEDVRMPGGA